LHHHFTFIRSQFHQHFVIAFVIAFDFTVTLTCSSSSNGQDTVSFTAAGIFTTITISFNESQLHQHFTVTFAFTFTLTRSQLHFAVNFGIVI
jgi:hypothetical protein